MQTFNWSFQPTEVASESILATIASPVGILLVPIVGVASWQLAAAAVTGFIAKENVVGTLAVCFDGLENLIDTEELALMEGAGAGVAGIMAITKVATLAYLMFNLLPILILKEIPSSIIAARLLTYQMSLGNMQDLTWMQLVW